MAFLEVFKFFFVSIYQQKNSNSATFGIFLSGFGYHLIPAQQADP